jgi:hypothetical protein
MGAALTYARRYALFTLVGIAGEDDLDAPDLPVTTTDPGPSGTRPPEKMNGNAGGAAGKLQWHRKLQPAKPVLDAEASRTIREKLSKEAAALDGVDTAIEWAGRSLEAKNHLTSEDAAAVEAAFRERMQVLQPDIYSVTSTGPAAARPPAGSENPTGDIAGPTQPSSVPDGGAPPNKAAALRIRTEAAGPSPKPRRSRDRDHLRFISRQPCTVCGRQPCEAHHIRFAQPSALGRRVSDEFTVPLCRLHHRELHRIGNERSWWEQLKIDPLPIAARFWQLTKGVPAGSDDQSKSSQEAAVGRFSRSPRQSPPPVSNCRPGLHSLITRGRPNDLDTRA